MLEDIEIFCAIARAKNFSKAARALHISPSVVTRRLRRLEKRLDVRLFHRTTRQVTLTEAGQLYYQEVSDILNALTAADQQIKGLREEVTGTLKVGLPASISHSYVSRHLHEFLRQFPSLNIRIINGNHLLDLLENRFDVILHCGMLPDSTFHYKKLGVWRKVICASPDYLQTHGIPQQPTDLSRHNCLDHQDNFQYTWQFQQKQKMMEFAVRGNIRVNSSIDLCNLAVSGLGIVYLPSFSVYHQLKSKNLISILEQYQPPVLGMYLIYPSKQHLNKKTRVFIDFLTTLMTPVFEYF